MRDIALGDVRVLVLLSMCHPRMGAGEQPHPTWTQMAHSSTVKGWLGVVMTPAATFLAVYRVLPACRDGNASGPSDPEHPAAKRANRLPGHGDEMYLR